MNAKSAADAQARKYGLLLKNGLPKTPGHSSAGSDSSPPIAGLSPASVFLNVSSFKKNLPDGDANAPHEGHES